ncbi:MAG: 4Fe-4S binding protein [Planctomycetes bacterium]|nr:4Fe-4S binding protein [Planctomycetota bacterium]
MVARSKRPAWKKKLGFFALVRNYTVVLSAGLMNLNLFGLQLRSVCTPGFNCHGCPWATSACPVGVATFGSALHVLPALAIASIFAVGAVAGRLICAFVCPFGLFQELVHRIPSRKFKLPRFTRHFKYGALALLVFALPFALGFEQEGYLRIDQAEFTAPGEGADEDDDGESYEEWLKRAEKEEGQEQCDLTEETATEESQLEVRVTVTNVGEKPVADPVVEIICHDRPTAEGEALGPETDRVRQVFPGVVIPPGATLALPPFQIADTRETHVLFTDSPQARVEQHPRHDLYYCKLCPVGALEATVPKLVADQDHSWGQKLSDSALKLGIAAFFLGLMVFVSRPFCRLFCPLGATYALLGRVSLSGMTFDQSKCGGCGVCIEACPVDIDPTREVGGPDCILCGDCIKVCPRGALRRTFGLSPVRPDYRTFDLKVRKESPRSAGKTPPRAPGPTDTA